jgi:hypothetical protein
MDARFDPLHADAVGADSFLDLGQGVVAGDLEREIVAAGLVGLA